MARLVTLASLRLQAKRRADMENSSFLSDAEWNDLINASLAEIYDLLTTVYEDYFTSSYSFTTTGVGSYALPSDFYKLLGLDQNVGAPMPATCLPYEFAERNRYQDYTAQGQKFTVQYVPACPVLVNDDDTFDGVNGWEEYVVVDSARKARIKEETDVSEIEASKAALIKRINDAAPNRDAGQPGRVTDVYARDPYALFGIVPARYRIVGGNIQLKQPVAPWGSV